MRDGAFTCVRRLLSHRWEPNCYVDEPVTFHLNGEWQADLTYPFPLLATPTATVDHIELRFGAGTESRTVERVHMSGGWKLGVDGVGRGV